MAKLATPPPPPSTERAVVGRVVTTLSTSPAWRKWLHEFAKSEQASATAMLREAARRLAEEKGFEAPPIA